MRSPTCPYLTESRGRRPAKVLVLFVLVLPVLLGMVGLIIDGGLLEADFRETQNAADAAALAAAMDLYQGYSTDNAIATARAYVRQQDGLSGLTDAQIVVNIPPASGPYAGNTKYAEVIVAQPTSVYFMRVLGFTSGQLVRARAVAGYETGGKSEGVIVLDPRADNFSGLSVQGGAILKIGGAVIVNSLGKGIDQNGNPVESDYNQYAVATGNNGRIYTDILRVAGGVDTLENIYHSSDWDAHIADGVIDSADVAIAQRVVVARRPIGPDPLQDLPIPIQSQAGQVTDENGTVVSPDQNNTYKVGQGETRTFSPGVYSNIEITGGATVTFESGIYALSPQQANQGLKISGDPTVTGNGVLFYFTGSNYLEVAGSPGAYDIQDAETQVDPNDPASLAQGIPQPPPDPNFNQVNFANLDLNTTGGTVTLTGLNDPGNSLDGVLFFFRRRMDGRVAAIQGNPGADVHLTGAIYSKWGNFKMAGGATYEAQFVVGSMDVSGQAVVTILGTGKDFGLADLVYLVE
jgi:hypothetical protein